MRSRSYPRRCFDRSQGSSLGPVQSPLVLFERHYFARLTGGVFNAAHPDTSNPQPGGYGPSSRQYDRLHRAAALSEPAALKSASWGLFQIMGANHVAAGYGSVEAFVDGMLVGAATHLAAFVSLILHDAGLLHAIRAKDWAAFARLYNGRDYAINDYDTKMARAYASLTAERK